MSVEDELYRAIDENQIQQVRHFLRADPSIANALGETPPPLHWAIFRNRVEIAELLVDSGAELELKDQDRQSTPLDYAIMYGRKEIANMLIERGADTHGRLELAERAAAGAYDEFPDLPSRDVFEGMADFLRAKLEKS